MCHLSQSKLNFHAVCNVYVYMLTKITRCPPCQGERVRERGREGGGDATFRHHSCRAKLDLKACLQFYGHYFKPMTITRAISVLLHSNTIQRVMILLYYPYKGVRH